MFEKLNYIELSGEKYPLKCDMAVLEQIQDKYGDLIEFEDKIYRFIPRKDEKGEDVKNESGMLIGTYGYPNIKAVNDALFWMVEEGMEIEAGLNGKEVEKIDKKMLIRKVDISPIDLGIALHDEYVKCFKRKNR